MTDTEIAKVPITGELRNINGYHPHYGEAQELAHKIQDDVTRLQQDMTDARLRDLNGLWVRAVCVLKPKKPEKA